MFSRETKDNYLVWVLKKSINITLSINKQHCDKSMSYIADSIVEKWISKDNLYFDNTYKRYGIDYESSINLPREFGKISIDRIFFNDFRKMVLQDNIRIIGRNDNNDSYWNYKEEEIDLSFSNKFYEYDTVCRKDKKYNYWSIFSQKTGIKVRFSFDDSIEVSPQKSFAPELVDIKITDFCPFECKFWYQGSDKKGKHASFDNIKKIAQLLSELKVFEVAIGGGEPTLHPDFIEILKTFKNLGIIPNFTTKNLDWIKNKKDQIFSHIRSFAYSPDNINQIKDLYDILDGKTYLVNIHIVMGITVKCSQEFIKFLKKCYDYHFCVTLLGYKNTKRGEKAKPYDYSY